MPPAKPSAKSMSGVVPLAEWVARTRQLLRAEEQEEESEAAAALDSRDVKVRRAAPFPGARVR